MLALTFFYFYVYTEMKCGLRQKTTHDNLLLVWAEKSPAWYKNYSNKECSSFDQAPRSERQTSSSTANSIQQIHELIDNNTHLSIRQLHVKTGLSIGTIHHIVSYQLSDNVKLQRV